MAKYPPNSVEQSVDKCSLGGMNTFDDPKDIDPTESVEILNMVFDDGIIYPREGSLLYRALPIEETQQPFELLIPTTSDGINYMIACYGNHFYLDDQFNNQWIPLNQIYTPIKTNLYYGWTNWNNGIADDRFYFGNGSDPIIKWAMALNQLAVATASSDTSITLNDATRFPNPAPGTTQNIILMNAGTPISLQYTGKSANTLLLTTTVGAVVPINSSVTIPLVSVPEIDQEQTTVNSSIAVGEANSTGNNYKIAQSFVPTNSFIEGVIYDKESDTGIFTGNISFAIQADSAGAPSGTDLGNNTINNNDWLDTPLGMQGINVFTTSSISFSGSQNDLALVNPYDGYFANNQPITYTVTIDGTGTPDTFSWTDSVGNSGSGVHCSTSPISLSGGVTIDFGATTGHTSGDTWSWSYTPIPVTPGDTYWLVITTTTNDNSNHPNVGINTAGGYSGQLDFYNVTDHWTHIATSQLYFSILTTPFIPRGKVLATSQARLFIANSVLEENTINYSYSSDPENFTFDDTPASAGSEEIIKGRGGIIAMNDFGQYLTIEKEDIVLFLQFQFSSDLTSVQVAVTPIISGDDQGPTSLQTTINYDNVLYWSNQNTGITGFTPEITGGQTTIALNLISQKINNLITDVFDMSKSRVAGWNQKLFWLFSTPLLGQDTGINNGVLMFDLIRGVWATFDNWNAADVKPAYGNLYYLSLNDGAVYQCFVDYQDAQEGNPIAYTASFTTKRYNNNTPSHQMRMAYVYVQGLIDLDTCFYVDVLYNENGTLGKQTYMICGSNQNITQSLVSGGLGIPELGIGLLGGMSLQSMEDAGQPAVFSCYLELAQQLRPRNVTLRLYSVDIGSQWGVNNYTLVYLPQDSINVAQVLQPTSAPPEIL